jgi:hypothetical protein
MAEPIYVKVCMFVQKSEPTSRLGIKLKFGTFTEALTKPKEKKIRNPENVAPGGPKWGMEYAMFFNILAPIGKTRNSL